MANELYTIQKSTITPLFNQIRRITETEDAMTFEGATESLLNIVPGGGLPSAEESVFGDNDASVEFGIVSKGSLSDNNNTGHVGIEFKAVQAVAVLGVRIFLPSLSTKKVYLWNGNDELVKTITVQPTAEYSGETFYFTNPVDIAINETFVVSYNGYYAYTKVSEATFNSKLSYQSTRRGGYNQIVCPANKSTTYLYGVVDVIIGEVSAELPEEYQIARATMDDIANEVKRITGTTGRLTPAQTVTALQSITLQDKTVTPTAEVQTVIPDDGYYALSSVMVEAITEDNEAVTEIVNDELEVIENGTY